MNDERADISVRLSFEADADADVEFSDLDGEYGHSASPPRMALKVVDRSRRFADEDTLNDVRRLLIAAGLRTSPIAETTSQGPRDHVTVHRRALLSEVCVTAADGTARTVQPGASLDIGRRPGDTGLVVAEESVSRSHCRVELSLDGQALVTDLDSSNGTWVERGDDRIGLDPRVPLALVHGDRLWTGSDVALVTVEVREPTD